MTTPATCHVPERTTAGPLGRVPIFPVNSVKREGYHS